MQGPQVFTPVLDEKENRRYQEEVSVYVTKWMAFKELAMVLLSNLNDILNRWICLFTKCLFVCVYSNDICNMM